MPSIFHISIAEKMGGKNMDACVEGDITSTSKIAWEASIKSQFCVNAAINACKNWRLMGSANLGFGKREASRYLFQRVFGLQRVFVRLVV